MRTQRNRSRAYVRAAAARYRTRRLRRLDHEWGGGYYDTIIDLDELRRDIEGAHRRSWRLRRLDADQLIRVKLALQLPELDWPTVNIDQRLIKLLGPSLVRDLAPWSFPKIAGFDQRFSYYRMDVEPEWTLPDIVRDARPVRKRVWQRDEIDDWEDDDFIVARRQRARTSLYERWAGGELRT